MDAVGCMEGGGGLQSVGTAIANGFLSCIGDEASCEVLGAGDDPVASASVFMTGVLIDGDDAVTCVGEVEAWLARLAAKRSRARLASASRSASAV